MKKIATILVLLATMLMNAQETTAPVSPTLTNQLSVRFSNLTGYGVAYQYNFLDDYAIRTTAWFKYYEHILGPEEDFLEKETNKDYNFGIDLQRNIFKEDKYRVFAFGGAGYAIKEKINEEKNQPINGDKIDDETISIGAGFGLEYFFMKNLSADLGLSYKFDIYRGTKFMPITQSYVDDQRRESGLGINVGVNFNF